MKSSLGLKFSLLLVAAAASWGLGTVLTKHALSGVPPFTLAVVQLAASSLFLWSLVLAQGLRLPLTRRTGQLALTGLLEPGLATIFVVLGLKLTTATMTTLIFAAQPALVALLAWPLLRERLSRPMLALALLAALGVGLVAGVDVRAGGGSLLGNLLVTISLLSCSLYLVWSRRWVMDLHPVLLVALQQTVGLALVLALWPIEMAQSGWGALAALDPAVWGWAVLSGIVYYGLGFWFYVTGLKHVPAGRAAQFISLTPVFGLGGALALLGERLLPAQWLGAALIVGAVALIARLDFSEPEAALQPVTPAPSANS